MSRTKIYKMMDSNKSGILLIGSNAISIDSLLFNNGVGFSQSCYQKSHPSFNDLPIKEAFIEEFDASAWLNETNSFLQANVNNVNSTSDYLNTEELENTYSLDDILEGNTALLSPASSSSRVSINTDDTPVASPLSDSLDFELEKFLNDSGTMGDFNNGNSTDDLLFESSSEGIICEDMELNMIQNDLSIDLSVNMPLTNTLVQGDAQPASPDSGIASPQAAEERNFDLSSDSLLNMLNQAVQQNSRVSPINESSETIDNNNTLNSILLDQLLTFNSEATIKDENDQQAELISSGEEECSNQVIFLGKKRHQPYKRRPRTEEQKVRKKAQNRNAAVRYRNKKKEELQEMMEEEEKLAEKNKELSDKVNGLKKEVEYLKSLMLDVIKARLAKGHDNLQNSALEMLLQSAS